jgi:hypothetical protein
VQVVDMAAVVEIIAILERTVITKEALEVCLRFKNRNNYTSLWYSWIMFWNARFLRAVH